jgi:hypothetical protein
MLKLEYFFENPMFYLLQDDYMFIYTKVCHFYLPSHGQFKISCKTNFDISKSSSIYIRGLNTYSHIFPCMTDWIRVEYSRIIPIYFHESLDKCSQIKQILYGLKPKNHRPFQRKSPYIYISPFRWLSQHHRPIASPIFF